MLYGLADGSHCDDPACQLHPLCWRPEICDNRVDDNGNGLIDCDDPECRGTPMCWVEEICDNGIDDNHNGATDCEEATCFGAHPACMEQCDNGLDDNRDGLVDCDDPLCAFLPACGGPEICFDDDGDGRLTCADPSCMANDPACWPQEEICWDGLDNDGNGLWDCEDPVCWGTPECGPVPVGEDCLDGIDNDGNGLADCEDPFCFRLPHCQDPTELCGDGWDNDGNGLADCDDPACVEWPTCGAEEVCGDGWDNDGNGLADCRDPACLDVCGGLSCRELNDCLGGCPDGEPACADLCFARATPEAAATFEAAIACLDATGGDYAACRAEIDACLGVEICDNGVDDEPDGYADCDDMDCRGAPGCEPSGSMTCAQLNDCLGQCPGDDQLCLTMCFRRSSPAAVAAFDAAIACIEANGGAYEPCMDLIEACLLAREVCDDGFDNNGDGLVDCEDPGCWNAPACVEPEACDNGVDDDRDGFADCDDFDCALEPVCTGPPCPDVDLGRVLGQGIARGTTVGAGNGSAPATCGYSFAPEVAYLWSAPRGGIFRFDTEGSSFDTVLYLRDGCEGEELACNDDDFAAATWGSSQVTLRLRASQTVAIFIDGTGASRGDFQLNISAVEYCDSRTTP